MGSTFKNLSGQALHSIAITFKGATSDTFGPYIVLTYRLPGGKSAGRVIPFSQGSLTTVNGQTTATFTPTGLELPDNTVIQDLEIIAIGENGGGSVTISDVSVNGTLVGKLLTTLNTCDALP